MKGSVSLEGLEFFAYHGFYQEERKVGNKYIVDVKATFTVNEQWNSDDIALTLNYEQVYGVVKEVMEGSHKLLEKVAHDILTKVKFLSGLIEIVSVRVSKENPPIGGICKYSTITLEG